MISLYIPYASCRGQSASQAKTNFDSAMGRRGSKRNANEGRQAAQQQRQNAAPKDNPQQRKNNKIPPAVQSVNSKTPESPSTPNLPPQDEHTPLKGFNAVEVDSLLKKGFDVKAPVYKPDTQPQKAGNAWGAKGMLVLNRLIEIHSLTTLQPAQWPVARTSGSSSESRSQRSNRRVALVKEANMNMMHLHN